MAEKFPLMTYVTGILARLNANSRKPTAYLYNGIRLPALPEWDREKYPYVVMQSTTKSFRFFSNPSVWNSSGVYCVGYQSGDDCLMAHIRYVDGQWSEFTEDDDEHFSWFVSLCKWSNFDIVYDGKILLEGSEPVPVYE